MRKDILISVVISLAVIVGAIALVRSGAGTVNDAKIPDATPAVIVDGVQVIEVLAHGGYSPRNIAAKAGIPTVLKVKTNNTYDCSVALTIPKLDYRKFLGPTGTTEIQISKEQAAGSVRGLCSMGMYSFEIRFQ